jgi:large subunit ribosomal protein L33
MFDKKEKEIYIIAVICIFSMSQDNAIKLECTVCKTVNYRSHKNKKKIQERLEVSKFCQGCGKHTPHKETK